VLEYGQFGFTRTIHMDRDTHPASIAPSRAGHSIGRWEGDVLVVDTIGFAPGVLSPPVMHGAELHVVERFSLDPAASTLTREYVADDPVHFTGRYEGGDSLQVADVPYAPDPCKELWPGAAGEARYDVLGRTFYVGLAASYRTPSDVTNSRRYHGSQPIVPAPVALPRRDAHAADPALRHA
jgi:hypothetical protein